MLQLMFFIYIINFNKYSKVLCRLFEKEHRDKTKILLRHEVCFIFGQLENERALPTLEKVL